MNTSDITPAPPVTTTDTETSPSQNDVSITNDAEKALISDLEVNQTLILSDETVPTYRKLSTAIGEEPFNSLLSKIRHVKWVGNPVKEIDWVASTLLKHTTTAPKSSIADHVQTITFTDDALRRTKEGGLWTEGPRENTIKYQELLNRLLQTDSAVLDTEDPSSEALQRKTIVIDLPTKRFDLDLSRSKKYIVKAAKNSRIEATCLLLEVSGFLPMDAPFDTLKVSVSKQSDKSSRALQHAAKIIGSCVVLARPKNPITVDLSEVLGDLPEDELWRAEFAFKKALAEGAEGRGPMLEFTSGYTIPAGYASWGSAVNGLLQLKSGGEAGASRDWNEDHGAGSTVVGDDKTLVDPSDY